MTIGPATPSRRVILTGAFAALSTTFGVAAMAQRAKTPPRAEIPIDELMAPGRLPETIWGNPDAPVTIVEYASITCGHCAAFHNGVWPALEQKYIKTGQVKFVLREFPLDTLALFASMLTRCAGPEKGKPLLLTMFKTQHDWGHGHGTGNPAQMLLALWEAQGLDRAGFTACAEDVELRSKVVEVRRRASEVFGVNATPTFFINGKRLEGPTDTIATFDAALQPLLKK